jgi:hypothetical protein
MLLVVFDPSLICLYFIRHFHQLPQLTPKLSSVMTPKLFFLEHHLPSSHYDPLEAQVHQNDNVHNQQSITDTVTDADA